MQCLIANDVFFQLLRQIDLNLFLIAKSKPCSLCGSILDTAHYPRKPRGAGELEDRRFSLCCRKEGCRHRVTPPSLRFLGRRVYSAWVVILAVEFYTHLGLRGEIARQTLSRWRKFWKLQLSEGASFMRWARGFLLPGTPACDRPGQLLPYFGFPERDSWIPILKFFTQSP